MSKHKYIICITKDEYYTNVYLTRMPSWLTTIKPIAKSGVLNIYANILYDSQLHLTDCFHSLFRPLIKPVSQPDKAFSAPHNRLCHTTTTQPQKTGKALPHHDRAFNKPQMNIYPLYIHISSFFNLSSDSFRCQYFLLSEMHEYMKAL